MFLISSLVIQNTLERTIHFQVFIVIVGQIGAFNVEPDFPTFGVYGVLHGFSYRLSALGGKRVVASPVEKHCGDNAYNIVFIGHY